MSSFDSSTNDPAGTTPGPGAPYANNPVAGSAAPFTGNDPYAVHGAGPAAGYNPGYMPPPSAQGFPNPILATWLGFIPGVGAMYNGQFAKGLAQIVIFAVLVSLADHVNGIFGLLIAGWIFYMVFDSYQTARARREGLQVPDPFGLNNIGERMGIGNGPNWSDFIATPAPGQAQQPPASGYTDGSGPQSKTYAEPANTYGTGTQQPYSAYANPGHAYTPPANATYTSSAYPPGGVPYGNAPEPFYPGPPTYPTQPPYPPQPSAPFGTYASPYPSPVPPLPAGSDGLPTGAFWLIGFGILALIGTLSHRFYWSNHYLHGAIVGTIGIVLLVTHILRARSVYPAGTAAAAWYTLRSARIGLVLLALGIAMTLDNAGLITWEYLWPYLLILLGVFLLLERAAHNRMLAADPITPSVPGFAGEPFVPSSATSHSFVPPVTTRDEEGRES